jgi:hypothetical protein
MPVSSGRYRLRSHGCGVIRSKTATSSSRPTGAPDLRVGDQAHTITGVIIDQRKDAKPRAASEGNPFIATEMLKVMYGDRLMSDFASLVV